MTTTTIRPPALVFLLVLILGGFAPQATAQRSDLRTWFEIELETRLKNGLEFSGEIEHRLKERSNRADRYLYTVSVEYDLLDYLSASGGVRLLMVSEENQRLQPRYRLNGDLSAQYELARTRFSFRTRLQYGFSDLPVLETEGPGRFYNRNRIRATHPLFGTRVTLAADVESWGNLFSPGDRYLASMRYGLRAEYALSFLTAVKFNYMIENEVNRADPLTAHILLFGFSHTF